ncbi:oocyte zinc finger protein XlCOF28-like [Galleria mellonella]|uniref:Oocyte zinc finger protein XlCOF28-like n=1 Tax=Galleria mellonella TaxID=7137 RepID=A0A6J1X8S3_GALME|nr:oocyte zinc finger protein XlCOF28-like [Galleria mellonella]
MTEKVDSNNSLFCAYCGKEFKYESQRKRHQQSHSLPFQCKVCKKRFSFISALRRHEKQHERTGSVQCTECKGKFRDETLLKRHIKYAHKEKCVCSQCSTIFNSELALRTHMKTHKPESERKYRCSADGCNKSFNFAHHLKNHEFTHTKAKQHYCKICGKGFIQPHHMKTHMKSHEPDENKLCCIMPNCTKKFSNEYARKRHLATHKNKMDSGISSDSSAGCDVTHGQNTSGVLHNKVEFGQTSGCTTSDINTSLNLEKSLLKETPNNNKSTNNDKLSNANTIDNSTVRDCKSALGGCIMGDGTDINKNCLCAQISSPVNEYYDLIPEENNHKLKELHKNENLQEVNKNIYASDISVKSTNTCEGCDCGGVFNTSDTQVTNCVNIDKDSVTSENECGFGLSKTKEIFDMETNENMKLEKNENIFVSFNSCKSVLGKCIVSGNGTMGEGCLCARMALDDQSMIAKEIDEITPQPNIY